MVQEILSLFQNNTKLSPKYVFELIPAARQANMTRHKNSIPLFNVKYGYSKNNFFSLTLSWRRPLSYRNYTDFYMITASVKKGLTIIEWNNLDSSIRNSASLVLFRKRILAFIRPSANSTIQCHNPKRLKLITKLRLGLSHFRFHKYKHSFQDTWNPICNYGNSETTIH